MSKTQNPHRLLVVSGTIGFGDPLPDDFRSRCLVRTYTNGADGARSQLIDGGYDGLLLDHRVGREVVEAVHELLAAMRPDRRPRVAEAFVRVQNGGVEIRPCPWAAAWSPSYPPNLLADLYGTPTPTSRAA